MRNYRDELVKQGGPDFSNLSSSIRHLSSIIGGFTKDQSDKLNCHINELSEGYEQTGEFYYRDIKLVDSDLAKIKAIFSFDDVAEWCKREGYVIVPRQWVDEPHSNNTMFTICQKSAVKISYVKSNHNHKSLSDWDMIKKTWTDDFKLFLATIIGANQVVLDSMTSLISSSTERNQLKMEHIYIRKFGDRVMAMCRCEPELLPIHTVNPVFTVDQWMIDLSSKGDFTMSSARDASGLGEKKLRAMLEGLVESGVLEKTASTKIGVPASYKLLTGDIDVTSN